MPSCVTATDVLGTADALYRALTQPPEERKELAERLRKVVEAEDVTWWLHCQLEDIEAHCEERGE